ncbi:MAG: peptidase T [Lachnospiraceae bacterium]|nr:peptidase T [Lachnospiraceae bacterium]
MRAYERLLNYVKIYTTSDDETGTTPSTARQFDLAKLLVGEMKEMGIADARVDENCNVYGTVPATPGLEDRKGLGFIAHLDTAPDCCGENVNPQVWENYDGGELEIGNGLKLTPAMFPHLPKLAGRTLITSDGSTLLGADDKAGIAEIMTLAEQLLAGGMPHGKICLAFTPDEEIGGGAETLDLDAFGAAYAYTVDGGCETELSYENFNAAEAVFKIRGVSVHPGDSKDTMINASLVACEINAALPAMDIPARTEGYEGFFHLCDISGNVENAKLTYIVRDHSLENFNARCELLRHIEKCMNERYGAGTVELVLKDQYRNMIEKIRPCKELIDYAKEAIREAGSEPVVEPIRGGTDGAQLSFRGLPCPNLGTAGYAFHGPYEHITAEGMDFVVEVLKGITKKFSK